MSNRTQAKGASSVANMSKSQKELIQTLAKVYPVPPGISVIRCGYCVWGVLHGVRIMAENLHCSGGRRMRVTPLSKACVVRSRIPALSLKLLVL